MHAAQHRTPEGPGAEILYPTLLCRQADISGLKKSPAAQIQSLYPTGAQRKERNPDMMIQNQLSYIRRPLPQRSVEGPAELGRAALKHLGVCASGGQRQSLWPPALGALIDPPMDGLGPAKEPLEVAWPVLAELPLDLDVCPLSGVRFADLSSM